MTTHTTRMIRRWTPCGRILGTTGWVAARGGLMLWSTMQEMSMETTSTVQVPHGTQELDLAGLGCASGGRGRPPAAHGLCVRMAGTPDTNARLQPRSRAFSARLIAAVLVYVLLLLSLLMIGIAASPGGVALGLGVFILGKPSPSRPAASAPVWHCRSAARLTLYSDSGHTI